MKPDGVHRGDRTLTTSGVGYVQSRGVRGGAIVDVDEASQAIAQAVERAEAMAGRGRSAASPSCTAGGQLASHRCRPRSRSAAGRSPTPTCPAPSAGHGRSQAGAPQAIHTRADRLVGGRPAPCAIPARMFGRSLGLELLVVSINERRLPDLRPLRRARPPAVRRRGRRALRLGPGRAGGGRDGPRLHLHRHGRRLDLRRRCSPAAPGARRQPCRSAART